MTKYGSPIICSLGRFPDCGCEEYYPLGNTEEEAIRKALELMENPPDLRKCEQYRARRFLDCYSEDNSREFQPGIPLVVEIKTGKVVALSIDDFSRY